MSAFDEARKTNRPSTRSGLNNARAASAVGGAFDSAGSSAAVSSGASYQNADRLYMSTCESIEKELRKLTTLVAAIKKSVEQVGTSKDSTDLRKKLEASIDKGKDSVKSIGSMLKSELTPAVDSPDISAKERTARRMQQSRFMKDFKEAAEAFTSVAGSAQQAERRYPNPPKAGEESSARRGKGAIDAEQRREEDRLLQRMQQVDFDVALIDERDEAITDIAAAIVEVNDTFKDLAQIVEEQGRDIEKVEVNIGEANQRVEEGVGHLEKAEKSQKGYRKWILIFVLILILGAGGIATYFVLSDKK